MIAKIYFKTIIIYLVLVSFFATSYYVEAQSWPNCAWGCNAKDVIILNVYAGDINGNDLGLCNPSTGYNVYLWTIIDGAGVVRGQPYVLFDIYINGIKQNINIVESCICKSPLAAGERCGALYPGTNRYNVPLPSSLYPLGYIHLTCQDQLELRNVIITWTTGKDDTCTNPALNCANHNSAQCNGPRTIVVNPHPPGSITVEKVTFPTGSIDSFNFLGTGFPTVCSLNSFTLTGGNSIYCSNLPANNDYIIQESALPSGWDLTNIAIVGTTNSIISYSSDGLGYHSVYIQGDRYAKVRLASSESAKIIFTDKKRGQIIVDKVTSPSGDAQAFSFTPSYGPAFTLTDTQAPQNSGLLPQGTYTVFETVPSGWDLASIVPVIVGSGGSTFAYSNDGTNWHSPYQAGDRFIQINLMPGDAITLTFTNTLACSIEVTKTGMISDELDDQCRLLINYTIVVQNLNDNDLEEVYLEDSLLWPTPYIIPELHGLGSVTVKANYSITYDDILNEHTIYNIVHAYILDLNGQRLCLVSSSANVPITLGIIEDVLKSKENRLNSELLTFASNFPDTGELEDLESLVRCESTNLELFASILEVRWEGLSPSDQIKFLASYEDLLRRHAFNLIMFDHILQESVDGLDGKRPQFLASFEDLLKRQAKVCKLFEKLEKYLSLNDNEIYEVNHIRMTGSEWKREFLFSFENILRLKDNPLSNFGDMLKGTTWSFETKSMMVIEDE
jgi:hypothetical protein